MKELIDLLLSKGYIFKSILKIDNKNLNTKKRIDIFVGIDLKGYYIAIFYQKQKSRFLRKSVNDLSELFERLKIFQDHNFKKKLFVYDMPICSKAKKELIDNNWRLIDATT